MCFLRVNFGVIHGHFSCLFGVFLGSFEPFLLLYFGHLTRKNMGVLRVFGPFFWLHFEVI